MKNFPNSKSSKPFAAIAFLFCSLAEGRVLFNETCPVQSAAGEGATTVCRPEAGVEVRRFKKANDVFYFVETEGCRGFVPGRCLRVAEGASASGRTPERATDRPLSPSAARAARAEANREPASTPGKFFRMGPFLSAGAIWAKPGSNVQASSGTDFGGGLTLSFSLSRDIRLSLLPTVEMMRLSRKVDGSGALSDPNPSNFDQRMLFVGGAFMGGIKLMGSLVASEVQDWWFDLGGEFLTPLSASQSDSFGNEISFTSPDRLLFLVLGPSGDFSISRGILASAYLQFLYNVGAAGGSQLYGGRLRLALNFNL